MFFVINEATVLMVDNENVHHLFFVCVQKSRQLRRRISFFRTERNVIIALNVHATEKDPCISLTIKRSVDGFVVELEEEYFLYPNGDCHLFISSTVRSSTGCALHSFRDSKRYTSDQVLARNLHEGWFWLHNQLDVLANWLTDKNTVRVDPYNPNRVLGEEDDNVDRTIAHNLAVIDNFRRKLRKTPLTPGIHDIE